MWLLENRKRVKKINELTSEPDQARKQLEKFNSEIKTKDNNLNQLQKEHDALTRDLNVTNDKFNQQQTEIEQLQNELKIKTEQIEEKAKIIDKLEGTLDKTINDFEQKTKKSNISHLRQCHLTLNYCICQMIRSFTGWLWFFRQNIGKNRRTFIKCCCVQDSSTHFVDQLFCSV